jgi:hypothetical protein
MATRYTIVLDDDAMRDIERLRAAYRLKSKADVFDLASTVLSWIAQQQADGYDVGRARGDDFQPLLMPRPLDVAAWRNSASEAKDPPEGLAATQRLPAAA